MMSSQGLHESAAVISTLEQTLELRVLLPSLVLFALTAHVTYKRTGLSTGLQSLAKLCFSCTGLQREDLSESRRHWALWTLGVVMAQGTEASSREAVKFLEQALALRPGDVRTMMALATSE